MSNLNVDTPFSPEQIKDLFSRFDYNDNKILSLAEIDKAVAEIWPDIGKHKGALMRAYKAAEVSNDGFIEIDEFKDLLYFLAYYDKLYDKFEKLDTDNDHHLDFDEFQKGLEIVGLQLDPADAKKEFDTIDINGGGIVLFDEFCMYMAKKFGTNSDQRNEQALRNKTSSPLYKNKTNAAKNKEEAIQQISLNVDFKWTKEQLHDLFKRFDVMNNNGLLSLAEIDKGVMETWPEMSKHKHALMRAYKASDKSADGFINEKEFEDLLYFLAFYDKISQLFESADTNHDQRIDCEEFKKALKHLGINLKGEHEIKAEFKKIDLNDGGYIMFDEFAVYLAKKYGAGSKERTEIASKNLVSYNTQSQSQHNKVSNGSVSPSKTIVKSSELSGQNVPSKLKPVKAKVIKGINPIKDEKKEDKVWDEKSIHELFKKFDATNHNGLLSLAEIDKAIQHYDPDLFKHKPAIMRAYKAADKSKDGFISESEFTNLMHFLYYYDKLYSQFTSMDSDGDHRIDFEEFKKGCGIVRLNGLSEKGLQKAFNTIDENNGGKILFDEFCHYLVERTKGEPQETLPTTPSKSQNTDKGTIRQKRTIMNKQVSSLMKKPETPEKDNVSIKSQKPRSRTNSVTSESSNISSLERKLNQEIIERKRLERVIESLKHQLEQYNPKGDNLTKNYLSANDQLADKNFKLQQKLDAETKKNATLNGQVLEISEKLRQLEVRGKKNLLESSKQAKDQQQVSQLTKELKDAKAGKAKWEKLYEGMAKKLAAEEERNKKLQDEVALLKKCEKKSQLK